jgi:diguanylate cyclase
VRFCKIFFSLGAGHLFILQYDSMKDTARFPKLLVLYFAAIFVVFAAITIGSLSIIYSTETSTHATGEINQEFFSITLQKSIISESFDFIFTDLRYLSLQNELIEYLATGDDQWLDWMEKEYLLLSKSRMIYDQIRYLDDTGLEVVRVNNNNGKPIAVDRENLQSKADRYYFKDAFVLDKNKIFVSPFDLNIENGKIETPLKPMIRFAMPVFDNNGKKRGIIILNYLGTFLINSIREASMVSAGEIMLMNPESYWLCGDKPEKEWGFMMPERSDHTFCGLFPKEWNVISKEQEGQFRTTHGLFTFTTIYPLMEGVLSSTGSSNAFGDSESNVNSGDYYWKIVSYLSDEELKSASRSLFKNLRSLAVILLLASLLPSWIISKFLQRRREEKKQLWYTANFDRLTGIPNRPLFEDRLSHYIQAAKRYDRMVAVLYMDLDGFKAINDNYGHGIGDILLSEVAERFKNCLRESDTIARVGGDEFVALVPEITSGDDVSLVAEKLIGSLTNPIIVHELNLMVGVSIGIALFPDHGKDENTIVKQADNAMYAAKKAGKNTYRTAIAADYKSGDE